MQDTATTIDQRSNPLVGLWRQPLFQAFLNDPVTLVSGVFILVIFTAVIFAPLVAPHKPLEQQVSLRHLQPLSVGTATLKQPTADQTTEDRLYLLAVHRTIERTCRARARVAKQSAEVDAVLCLALGQLVVELVVPASTVHAAGTLAAGARLTGHDRLITFTKEITLL